jgi:hypothetical protein
VPVVNLFADAPRFAPRAAAYLLAAYATEFPAGTVFVAVVDPGVGTETRAPVILEADQRIYVGPGNGLLQVIAQTAREARLWEITWRPEFLSASFHGRDLFAPVAAGLACGRWPACVPLTQEARKWPEDLPEVIYLDHFGNAITGLRERAISATTRIEVAGRVLSHARTFGCVAPGVPFWYENANGLVELAVNQGDAGASLGLKIGMPIRLLA